MARRDTAGAIRDTALELFNRFGAPNVTTNHIADELDISPGNLYYHFRSRDQILTTLFDAFEREALDATAAPGHAPEFDDLWLHLHLMFEIQARYRFLFRDLYQLLEQQPSLQRRFRALLEYQRGSLQQIVNRLAEAGRLRATSALQRATLTRNALLIVTCWLGYSRLREDRAGRDPNLAVWQVLSLFEPYLSDQDQRKLEDLARQYLG